MSIMACGRRDISDLVWEKTDPRLPGREASWGGGARDNLRFVNAVFRVMRAGAPWRDRPSTLATGATPADTSSVGAIMVWERPPEIPIDEPDPAWLMIDAGHCCDRAGLTHMRRAREDATGT